MSHLNILIRPVLFLLIVAALSHAYSGTAKRSLDIFDGGMGGEMKLGALPKPTRMPHGARKNGDGTVRPSDEGEMEKPSKRALDSMEDGFGFKKKRALGSLDGAGFGFDKRALDSMDGAGFGFDKRALGSLDGAGFGFDKRALGSLDGAGFGFDKRALGSLDGAGFGFDKRALGSLDGAGFGFDKRALDSLDGNGLGWAKRSRQHRIMGFGSRAGALGFRALN